MARDIEREMLLFDREGGVLHQMNATARDIYLLCDGTRTADEIAASLADLYEVSPESARKDVADMLERLVALGAVEPC